MSADNATQEPSILVAVPEAARLLGVSDTTVWRLVADDTLPSVIVGRRRRMIRRDAIEQYLKHQEGKDS